MDNEHNRTTSGASDIPSREVSSFNIDISDTELTSIDRQRRFHTYGLPASAPPAATRLRIFRAADLYDSNRLQQIFTSVYRRSNVGDMVVELDHDEPNTTTAAAIVDDQQPDLQTVIGIERDNEIQNLTQDVVQRPSESDTARCILNLLDFAVNETDNIPTRMEVDTDSSGQNISVSSMSNQHRNPSDSQTDVIQDHELPSVIYGHLDRDTIAKECHFNFSTPSGLPIVRFRRRSYAITVHSDISKEKVKDYILEKFGSHKVAYICVGEDIDPENQLRRLLIQILFNDKIDRRMPFFKRLFRNSCNYYVTDNDLAWNEYIKKCGSYEEKHKFVHVKQLSQNQSNSLLTSASATPFVPDTPVDHQASSVQPKPTASKRLHAVSNQTGKRRRIDDEIARVALALARDSVDKAMDYMEKKMPAEFMRNHEWYTKAFKFVRLRAEQQGEQAGAIDKEFVWPDSFPNCTPKLREVVDNWIRQEFFRVTRARCLVLIGPTGTGKTSFSLSLPGRVNYYKGEFDPDTWSDYARYSVFDDIPWDKFDSLGFPDKKNLLTQNGLTGVNRKYKRVKTFNFLQPSIVLMNRADAGSLLREPKNYIEQEDAKYWKERAVVYEMGPDEYFYPPRNRQTDDATTTSCMDTNERRRGGPHEFDEMRRQFYEKNRDAQPHSTNDFE